MIDMLRPVLLILFLSLTSTSLIGQTFNDGLELYESENYQEAADLFASIANDERAVLFRGKSHFAMGNDLSAAVLLQQALRGTTPEIVREAAWSMALLHVRMRNYLESLELLLDLKSEPDPAGIDLQAAQLYEEILGFLTEGERFQIFTAAIDPELRIDLVRYSIGRVDYETIMIMLGELEAATGIAIEQNRLNDLRNRIGIAQTYSYNADQRPAAPEGMVYKVGVALPAFEPGSVNFQIPRNLFFGITLAAEEFNARHSDMKVFLQYRDTSADTVTAERIMREFAWTEKVDAMIGPLYSEPARVMSRFSEIYEIPMLAPLANSDAINRQSHNYTYQLNPTFSVHGEQMARFAVNELQLDTLAILSEANSMGSFAASAFKQEAERLGATIAYYIDEDFAATGYDLSEYTNVFTPDTVLIDSLGYRPVKGIYAPFTGDAAETLTTLLMNALEAMRSTHITVMGSEELRETPLPERQLDLFPLFYSEPVTVATATSNSSYFDEDFNNRFGVTADYFARLGYDALTFLLRELERVGNPAYLKYDIQRAPPFNGLTLQLNFGGTQVNRAVRIRSREQADSPEPEFDPETN